MHSCYAQTDQKKRYLLRKICAACGRPFSWRKKWESVWEEVRYCSDRCRKAGKQEIGN
ncbi:MAG: DUF2256 domain-containing protein [Lewinellaceae bacterium]|nr:DUF2256 domain-containing protein [Lewinellaceae bacterium]